ncbi:MAG: hypothetical protein VB081_10100 [Christensenella sp.]|uniref:hypothetical protein n=1 Tax=Christensenella sp. TaxID=1935934 RepID=UPI002B21F900|nr:hypothetical protein [Christensenella sp.]MEA5003838.1 hypothetical protein [Christensenella sp.]
MKPILFNTEMVRAILEGRKTVTRRIVKHQPDRQMPEDHNICRQPGAWDGKQFRDLWYMDTIEQNPFRQKRWFESFAPYDKGEILYVRETWAQTTDLFGEFPQYVYSADYMDADLQMDTGSDEIQSDFPACIKWHPSIHMPKEAARIFLRVADVNVERLQDITEQDIHKEGVITEICKECLQYTDCQPQREVDVFCGGYEQLAETFADLWDRTIKKQDLDRCGWDANPWIWVTEFGRCEKPEGK